MSRRFGSEETALPNLHFTVSSQAAATIVLAAAMLGGGTPAQQSEAEGFVASELANHDKDLSSRLVAYLRSTVEVENDGAICVSDVFFRILCCSCLLYIVAD